MEQYIKDSINDTAQSFNTRVTLGEKTPNSLPYLTQIQDLMSMLITKKA